MFEQLTAIQARELQMYFCAEPFGELRQDMRTAAVLEMYYNSKRRKGAKALQLSDFILYTDVAKRTRDKRTGANLAARLDAMSEG